ncbi:MAG: Arm DNA-binding domain-containing protein, partial [Actinomycetota bacterium]
MRGHVEKKVRNGNVRYYPVIELDRDPATGKRRRKWHQGHARKKEALAALNEILHRRVHGAWVEPTRQTVAEYLSEWLAGVAPTVRPSTLDSYRRALSCYVVPYIGGVLLRDLDGVRLDALYAELLTSGGQRKARLSTRTVRYAHTVLHKAFKDAVRKRRLAVNPADFADPPRLDSPEMRSWTAAEARKFLAHVAGDRLYACYLLALTTGMRKGELLGLRWIDVDIEGARLSVRHTIIQIGYQVAHSEPKTKGSRRS